MPDGYEELRVKLEPARELVRVHAIGRLGADGSVALRDAIEELIVAGFGALVLDLRGVSTVEPPGARTLRAIANAARDRGVSLSVIPSDGATDPRKAVGETLTRAVDLGQ